MPTVTWVYRSKTLNKKMIRVNLKRRLGYIQPKATLICDYLLNTTTKHGTENVIDHYSGSVTRSSRLLFTAH